MAQAVFIYRDATEHKVYADIDQDRRIPLHLEEVNHSPDGFEYGYGGSGPAQLAYAILHELYGRETAHKYYQKFKWDVIASLKQNVNYHVLNVDTIDHWLFERNMEEGD